MENGSSLAVAELSIGDKVYALSGNKAVISEVYAFGHRDPDALAEFHVIDCNTGHCLVATAAHLVPVVGKGFMPMCEIELGDILHVNDSSMGQGKSALVTSICKRTHAGLYAPITLEGTIIVDGVGILMLQRSSSSLHFPLGYASLSRPSQNHQTCSLCCSQTWWSPPQGCTHLR